ncbi:MAG: cell division protein ZapA [Spirochaetes bacterium]|nr:cell division protein ZapA [Spirochaetota bacterium]
MNSTYSEGQKRPESQIVPIEILGVSFTIRTDESPDYIGGLVAELKDRLSKISSQMRIADPLKLALVTSLLILDELRRDEDQKAATASDFEASALIDDLDKRLDEIGL